MDSEGVGEVRGDVSFGRGFRACCNINTYSGKPEKSSNEGANFILALWTAFVKAIKNNIKFTRVRGADVVAGILEGFEKNVEFRQFLVRVPALENWRNVVHLSCRLSEKTLRNHLLTLVYIISLHEIHIERLCVVRLVLKIFNGNGP